MTDTAPRVPSSPALPWFAAGVVGLVALALGLFWWWPAAPTHDAPPLVLKSAVESLPGQTIKSYSLRVPHDGQLSLEVSTADPGEFSAYLVRIEESLALTRHAGLDIMTSFSAERTQHYRRGAPIQAGNYHLTLANFSPAGDHVPLHISINARLAR